MAEIKSSTKGWIVGIVIVVLIAVGTYVFMKSSASADVATTSTSGLVYLPTSSFRTIMTGTVVKGLSKGEWGNFTVKVATGVHLSAGKIITVVLVQDSTTYSIISSNSNTTFYYPINRQIALAGIPVGTNVIVSGLQNYSSSTTQTSFIAETIAEVRPGTTTSPTPTPTVTRTSSVTATTTPSYNLTFTCVKNGASCLTSPPDGSTINVGDEITVTATWPQTPTGTLKATPAPDNAGIQLTTVSHTANSLTVKIKGFQYSNPDLPSSSGNTYHIDFWAGTQQYQFFQVGVN